MIARQRFGGFPAKLPGVSPLSRADLLWLVLSPAYFVFGTARHELAHAVAAVAQGATIVDWSILPATLRGTFYFGYVRWAGGDVTWLATAAPYLVDLATVALGLALLRLPFTRRRHWLSVNLYILTIASPLLDSGYQYMRSLLLDGGDVGALLTDQPAPAVHAYFVTTIALYAAVNLRIVGPAVRP